MEDERIGIDGLVCSNFWSALCFAPRSLLLKAPYPETRLEQQIGFEDWGWNIEVLVHGAIHKIVRDTAHFIRAKHTNSLCSKSTAAQCIPAPSNYFVQALRQRERANSKAVKHVEREPLIQEVQVV